MLVAWFPNLENDVWPTHAQLQFFRVWTFKHRFRGRRTHLLHCNIGTNQAAQRLLVSGQRGLSVATEARIEASVTIQRGGP